MTDEPANPQMSVVFSRVALSDQVMQLIQERILDGVYAPGDRLNIDALTREFNVSSSPIRETSRATCTRCCAMPRSLPYSGANWRMAD